MKKLSKNHKVIITVLVICALLYGGWQVYRLFSFVGKTRQFVQDAEEYTTQSQAFWKEYESKPKDFYEGFAAACDSLLNAYAGYNQYPYYIPLENNPAIPAVILLMSPQSIKVVSPDYIFVTVLRFREEEEMGFGLAWKRNPASNSGGVYLGRGADGHLVYSR